MSDALVDVPDLELIDTFTAVYDRVAGDPDNTEISLEDARLLMELEEELVSRGYEVRQVKKAVIQPRS